MKNASKDKDNLRSEYDFSEGIRGKYAAQYAAGTNIVIISPELAEIFPDSDAVNEALRTLVRISENRARKSRKRPRKKRSKPTTSSRR